MELPSYKLPGLRRGAAPDAGAGLGVRLPGRHADPGRLDRRLGGWPTIRTIRAQIEPAAARSGSATRGSSSSAQADRRTERDELRANWPTVENQIAGAYLRQQLSSAGWGKLIEPVVRPLGWDWRIGCAAIASFPAREVVVATLGVIYNLGEEQDETLGRPETDAAGRHLGRHRPQGLQSAGGAVGHGVLRPVCPVRLDAGGHPPRDRHLVAGRRSRSST